MKLEQSMGGRETVARVQRPLTEAASTVFNRPIFRGSWGGRQSAPAIFLVSLKRRPKRTNRRCNSKATSKEAVSPTSKVFIKFKHFDNFKLEILAFLAALLRKCFLFLSCILPFFHFG